MVGKKMTGTELKTAHGTVRLKNPVIAASGTCGYGREMKEWFDLNVIGGLSVKGTTLLPREGNALPRIAECHESLLNAVGLQNPGIDKVVSEELPWLRRNFDGAILANISGFSLSEYETVTDRLADAPVDIIEVNISCPNVHGGGMAFGTDPKAAFEVTKAVRARTDRPVFIKLSPNVTDITAIAKACVDGGADGLCLINTIAAMRIDLRTRKPLLGNVTGGLSGPAVLPVAVKMVWQVAHAVKDVPIIGCGGVSCPADVLEMMMAGASAVEVGSASLVNPFACRDIAEGLPEVMAGYGIDNIKDIIGVC